MLLEEIATSATASTHLATLLNFLISSYFLQLKSVLIVHNSSQHSDLQQEYLNGVQLSFSNQSAYAATSPALLWLDVSAHRQSEFDEQMLRSVGFAIEGFITVLPYTLSFLHARYYATRNSELRLKDKLYLFLCEEHENPMDFLATEILQFYPHHLMIKPQPKQTRNKMKTLNKFSTNENITIEMGTKAKATRELKPTATVATLPTTSSSIPSLSSFSTQLGDINFELWIQKFVGAGGNLDAILLDVFLPNRTFVHNVELYPNKLLDLKDRTLKVGSLTYAPYVVTNYVTAGTGNTDPLDANDPDNSVMWLGSEAEIVQTFCKNHHCHLRVMPCEFDFDSFNNDKCEHVWLSNYAYGPDNWGIVYENETSTGLIGGIYTQHVEFAIGCIYDWYGNLTETSHPIARSSVTILGPAPGLIPPWYINIAPFSAQLWTFLLTNMIICSFTLYFLKIYEIRFKNLKLRRNRRIRHLELFYQSNLDIFTLFLQQPMKTTTINRFVFRFFIALLLVAAITLENTYSGQLKSILTVPQYLDPVDTSDKWIKSNWKWAAPHLIWVEKLWASTLLKDKLIEDLFRVYDHDTLYQLSFHNDFGLAVEHMQSGTFTFGKYITKEAMQKRIVLKDDLYFDYTRAVSIRGWPLMPLFNKHVRFCMESGLYEYWERQIGELYLDRQIQEMIMNAVTGFKPKDTPKALVIANIAGALFSLAFGYALATTVFVIEILRCAIKAKCYKTIKIINKQKIMK